MGKITGEPEGSLGGLEERRLTRRDVLRAMAAVGAGAASMPLIAACGGAAAPTPEPPTAAPTTPPAAEPTATTAAAAATATPAPPAPTAEPTKVSFAGRIMTFCSAGGAYQDAQREVFLKPYSKEFGVTIHEFSPNEYAPIKAQVEAGVIEWDVVAVGSEYPGLGAKLGTLEKLDYTVIDKTGVFPDLIEDYGIGNEFFSTVLGYNTNMIPKDKAPKSWADFWDVKNFPPGRTLYYFPQCNLEIALMADGVPVDKVNEVLSAQDDSGIERAFASLAKIKPYITTWWSAGAQPAQMLTDGEVAMATAWNGRFGNAIKDGAPIEIVWNQQVLQWDSLVMVKGTPNKDVGMDFIRWSVLPEVQANWPKYINYGPVNEKSYALIEPAVAAQLPSSPENAKLGVVQNVKWWNDHWEAMTERLKMFIVS